MALEDFLRDHLLHTVICIYHQQNSITRLDIMHDSWLIDYLFQPT